MQESSQLVPSSLVKDDLKSINGIGPGLESRLNTAGIYTFGQLASCTPEYLTRLFSGLTGMSLQVIQKKDLIGQARGKVSEAREAGSFEEPKDAEEQQHYATFVTNLLLDINNSVRQTRVKYVQGEDDISWPGWNIGRLVEYIQNNAHLTIPPHLEKQPPVPPAPIVPEKTDPSENNLAGTVQIIEIGVWPKDSAQPQSFFLAGTPYRINLGLELTGFSNPEKDKIAYTATIYASKLGSDAQLVIGEVLGEFLPSRRVKLEVVGRQIPHGDYSLSAFVVMYPPGKDKRDAHRLSAWVEGSLLQVS
jgi:hypothetical protein